MGSRFSRLKRGVEAASAFEEAGKKTGNDKDVSNNKEDIMKEDTGKEVPAIDNKDPENKEPLIENESKEESTNEPVTVSDKTIENNKPIEEQDASLESKTNTKKESAETKNVNQSLLEFDNKEKSTHEPSLIKEDLLAVSGEPDMVGKVENAVAKENDVPAETVSNNTEEDLMSSISVVPKDNLPEGTLSDLTKSGETSLTFTGNMLEDTSLNVKNEVVTKEEVDANQLHDKIVDEKENAENKKEMNLLELDLGVLMSKKEIQTAAISGTDEMKKEVDVMDSVHVESELEEKTAKHLEEVNEQEVLNDVNIVNDIKIVDLNSNTDLITEGNRQLIAETENHVLDDTRAENMEKVVGLDMNALNGPDEIGDKKVSGLFSTNNNEQNDDEPEGDVLIHADDIKMPIKDNEENSTSLLDFGSEEPKVENNDTDSAKKTNAVDVAILEFEPTGIESINTQDLLFLDTVKAQNGSKSEDPEVENLLNF